MGLDLSSFTNLTSNIGSLMPTGDQVVQQVALGAASGVVLAGLKSQMQSGALDPMGLFHQNAAPIPPTNNPNNIVGPTITSSAFAALPSPTQAQLMAAGVHIIAG